MAKFQWEATTRMGEKKRGVMEAETADIVESRLRNDGLTIQRVKKEPRQIQLTLGSGVTSKDLQIFTRQLATMIDAGLPLVQCLDILVEPEPEQDLRAHPRPGEVAGRARRRRSPTPSSATPRYSTTSTSTSSRPAKSAASSTRS